MTAPEIRLSVIDTLWPGHIAELVPHLDALGYHRYWATEHHGPEQSAAPAIMVALAAGLSHNLRVGSAGVLLSLYSPRAVAAQFRLLELLFPGRIDLGVASAVPPEPVRGAVLHGQALLQRTFAAKVEELASLMRAGREAGEPVGPVSPTRPALWVCGTSARSAELAGRLGARYALHHYQLDQPDAPGGAGDGRAVLDAYLRAFVPSAELSAPELGIACYGACADDEAQARADWAQAFAPADGVCPPDGRNRTVLPRPSFLGDPAQCREQLLPIAERYGATELVVQAFAPRLTARLTAYRLLSEIFELCGSGRPEAAGAAKVSAGADPRG